MQRGVGGGAFAPVQERRDKELTLGPAMLAGLGIGLLTLCGACFIAGYAVGRHSSPPSAGDSTQASAGPSAAQMLSTQSKPLAAQAGSQAASPEAQSPAPGNSDAAAGSAPASQTEPAQPSSGATAQLASSQVTSWMVQLADGFRPEDAEVLVNALRKRGYAASARRDPTDGLIHVRIGPFSTHDAATASRQKLLNDGYSAVIQP